MSLGNIAEMKTLLGFFLSSENEARQAAEEKFAQIKATDINGLILCLIKILLEDEDGPTRHQAAVAIRMVLREFLYHNQDALWAQLNPETKSALQTQLLVSLESEASKSVRRTVCDTVSALATKLSEKNEWPELNAQLKVLLDSTQPRSQSSALKILAELVPQMSEMIQSGVAAMAATIIPCAKSDDPDLRLECLGFITAVAQSEGPKVYKHFQVTIPDFIDCIVSLVKEDEELATEFLVKFVEIADSVAIFFKPHCVRLTEALIQIAGSRDIEDECRQMAAEVLLCLVEDKPQMCLKIPNIVKDILRVLLELMLTIEDDGDWIDDDDENLNQLPDSTRNYDIGENGLDRLTAALGGESVMPQLFLYVAEYMRKPEWQYRLVGIMAISQTAEYLPEEDVEAHLEEIITTLLSQLKDQHHRVRFAACQAIGQIALDLQPDFQKNYANVVLPALIETLKDPVPRVQSHAGAALINFTEEVEKADLLPFADTLMNMLFERITTDKVRMIREQCVTCIAVVAGVIESDFLKYYPIVVPATKQILLTCTSREERTIRGKAAECVSIIGLSVGAEVFEKDAHEIMQALLQIAAQGVEADDPIKEYFQETFCRICRTLKDGFIPYLPHLVPGVFKVLNVKAEIVQADNAEAEDMTIVSCTDGKYSGLKTSVIEEMLQALDLLSTFIEILGPKFGEYLLHAAQALLPLLDFSFSDDVKKNALTALAEVFAATRTLNESAAPGDQAGKETLQLWLSTVLEKVFKDLTSEDDDDVDIELMVAETGGLAKCLRNAGSNVLTAQQVSAVCTKVFVLMQESSNRRAAIASKKQSPDCEDEDISGLEDEESAEQTLRSTLLEIVAALMSLHPELYLQTGANLAQKFIETYLHPNCAEADIALALYVCDDILEHLKDMGAGLWPVYATRLIDSLLHESPAVRQAAAFGVVQAAKCSQFPRELIVQAAANLVTVLRDPKSRAKGHIAATDNAIAALGAVVLHRERDLAPRVQEYLDLWVDSLPLKSDDEEGRKVHADLIDLLVKGNQEVLGANKKNIPKLAAICGAIYSTEFSNAAIDEGIRIFINGLGFANISSIGANFDKKLQKGLQRIHRDILAAAKE